DRDRRAQRRRPAAERPARPALARAREPPGRERGAPVPALERRVDAADPEARADAPRPAPGGPGLDALRRSRLAPAPVSRGLVNRRIRLLLVVFVLALGATF